MRKSVLFVLGLITVEVVIFRFNLRPGGWGLGGLLLANAALFVGAEVAFQLLYRVKFKRPYSRVPKLPFSKMYFQPHPHITYMYKEGVPSSRAMLVSYPLQVGRVLRTPSLTPNNLRHNDGEEGDRLVSLKKEPGTVRVFCLGASTTGNYLIDGDRVYSYPLEMERYLRRRVPGSRIDVHNCGQGGWNSADILIDFMLNLVDYEPDVVVIYHAYNDLGASLTPGFRPDYSHARRGFGEVYHLFKWGSLIPDLPLGFYNYLVMNLFPYFNPRFGIIEAVSKGRPDMGGDFNGLATYRRNIEHIVNICKGRGIKVVLSTYAYYLHGDLARDPSYAKYGEGVAQENQAMRELAIKYGLPLVDNAALIPKEDRFFVDTVHFSSEGMAELARNMGEAVASVLEGLKVRMNHESHQLRK